MEYKDEWWCSTWIITIIAAFSFLIIPAIVAIILLIKQHNGRKAFGEHYKEITKIYDEAEDKDNIIYLKEAEIRKQEEKLSALDNDIEAKKGILNDKNKYIETLKDEFYKSVESEKQEMIRNTENELQQAVSMSFEYKEEVEELTTEKEKLIKEINRYFSQARKYKAEILGLKNFEQRFPHSINVDNVEEMINEYKNLLSEDSLLNTVVNLHLHSDHSKELRKLSTATKREINNTLKKYESNYTTKANKTIYNLMIIGLQAEVQILLYQLKFTNIEETKENVKDIITKFLAICGEGNKSILSTIARFLAEIEELYMELVDIEYKYYVYREKEKEEQRMIKEQMKQEAAERKQLAEERKKLDNEERKFKVEMDRNKELLQTETDSEKIKQLKDRLKELESQMIEIEDKKEEITSLTLGKAGYVYIISNLGSFGKNMFKIGMTRRTIPQDRVDELGSASVPFRFDVHAMIFSNDAVGLEQHLHKELSDQRVNKVNYRKEFFKTDIDSLQKLVEEIDPTAEFITTMLAEEYKQTLAMEENLAI